jgi:hypothetical protein
MANVVVAAPSPIGSSIGHVYPHETTSRVFDLAEQFQKFLATQPHATSVSSIKGLTPFNLSGTSSIWILDSGASHHMSYDYKSFFVFKSYIIYVNYDRRWHSYAISRN